MTAKQLEWRDAIGTAYIAVAVLAYVLAGVLALTSGVVGVAVWKLLFIGAICNGFGENQLARRSLALVRRSQDGWEEANNSNRALLVLVKKWERQSDTLRSEVERLRAENEALKRDA